MSDIGTVVIGDDSAFAVRLKKGKKIFTVSGSAIVKASLTSIDKSTIYIAEISQLESNEGSDWANSLVVVEFTEAQTTAVPDSAIGNALLEVQVADPKKQTWFIPVKITKGTIA